MGTAIATMMFAGCQNEQLIENVQGEGQKVTLKVSQNAGSRTALDGLQTVWSEGDQIYVTSADGRTSGILTLIDGAGDDEGTFEGYVFGSSKLSYSVYPVPDNDGHSMSSANVGKLDAPMVGSITGNEAAFTNSVGLVKLNIIGLQEGDALYVKGDKIGSTLKYDLASNQWVVDKEGAGITVTGVKDAEYIYVPVYTTNTANTQNKDVELFVSVIRNGVTGTPEKVTVPVAAGKVNPKAPILTITESGAIVDPSNPENAEDLGEGYIYVANNDELFAAVKRQGTVVVVKSGNYKLPFYAEYANDVTIICEEGVVFNEVRAMNVNGNKIMYATFLNENESGNFINNFGNSGNSAERKQINGHFVGCSFTSYNVFRDASLGKTAIFEDCIFDAENYAVHIGYVGTGIITFRRCIFSGQSAFHNGLTLVTFEDCTFKALGRSEDNWLTINSHTTMIDCEFIFDGSAEYEGVKTYSEDERNYTFTNCMVNGEKITESNYRNFEKLNFSSKSNLTFN